MPPFPLQPKQATSVEAHGYPALALDVHAGARPELLPELLLPPPPQLPLLPLPPELPSEAPKELLAELGEPLSEPASSSDVPELAVLPTQLRANPTTTIPAFDARAKRTDQV
jgi:hypothetical protein